jgi:hypothetical protein
MRYLAILFASGACTAETQDYLSVEGMSGYIVLDDSSQGSHFGAALKVTGPVAASAMTVDVSVSYRYDVVAKHVPATTGDQVWADGATVYVFGPGPLPPVLEDYCEDELILNIQLTGRMIDGHLESSGGEVANFVACNR